MGDACVLALPAPHSMRLKPSALPFHPLVPSVCEQTQPARTGEADLTAAGDTSVGHAAPTPSGAAPQPMVGGGGRHTLQRRCRPHCVPPSSGNQDGKEHSAINNTDHTPKCGEGTEQYGLMPPYMTYVTPSIFPQQTNQKADL